ncbi:hypothetical protein [[Clostridium] polysaccharolyticum]|uniref:Uncharacterized protein n=1 Tax=[Clostridium] polysaccharolyticum TaxID=29364 RepID=A0A1I0EHU4_9FIRM|nr:hypothetical protein [[Clostridium] polysaccharolyticum]SET44192.1 hypothetical protein SAMN04487772_1212 [[Clostridium] polysaccharolyticum]
MFWFIIIIILLIVIFGVISYLFTELCQKINSFISYLKHFAQKTDTVIIVAIITGGVSIIGVVISSIVSKIFEYKFNVKKFLYEKREAPYQQYINMVFKILEQVQNQNDFNQEESQKLISDFSKELILWGSNDVIRKWLNYRKIAFDNQPSDNFAILYAMEEIIFAIRKDFGHQKYFFGKLKKNDILSIFINDINKQTK